MIPRLIIILICSAFVMPDQSLASLKALRSVETENEKQIRDLRESEITQLRIALGRRLPKNRQAELYFRLAEIYFEAYRSTFLLEGRLHEKRVEQNRGARINKMDRTESKKILALGIKACEELIALRISYSRMDRIYFFLAFNYAELGKDQQSEAYFKKLVTGFPNSPFVGEGYRKLGDAAFERGQFAQAQSWYEKALRHSEADAAAPIYHRLAWSYYRVRSFSKAIDAMKQSVSLSKANEKYVSLRDESMRDIAIFMTEGGRIEEALKYFKSVSDEEDFYAKSLEKLGREYERRGEGDRAIAVYEALLKAQGDEELSFRILVKMVDLDLRKNRAHVAADRIEKNKIIDDGDEETVVAFKNLKAMVRRTGTENHEKSRKEPQGKYLQIADRFYSIYLNKFLKEFGPKNEISEILMYQAEIKREQKKWLEAEKLYAQILDEGDHRYEKEALVLRLASLNKMLEQSKTTDKPLVEKLVIDVAEELISKLPRSFEAHEAELKIIEILSSRKNTEDEAIEKIKDFLEENAATTQGLASAQIWLQILANRLKQNLEDSTEQVKEAFDVLRRHKLLLGFDEKSGGQLKKTMTAMELKISAGKIAGLEKSSAFQDAGNEYLKVGNQTSDLLIAEKSYASAIESFQKAELDEQVIATWARWKSRIAASKQTGFMGRSIATYLFIRGRYSDAAALFEEVGEGLTAARCYLADNKASEAARIWQKSPENYVDAALYYEEKDQVQTASSLYEKCAKLKQERQTECQVRRAMLYLKLQENELAQALFRKASQTTSRSPFASFAQLEAAKYEFSKQPKPQNLEGKVALFERRNQMLQKSVEAPGPWGVGALVLLSQLANDFADEMAQKPENRAIADKVRKSAEATLLRAFKIANTRLLFSASNQVAVQKLYSIQSKPPYPAQGALSGLQISSGSQSLSTSASIEEQRKKILQKLQSAPHWVEFGVALREKRESEAAILAFEKALSIDPQSLDALNNLGVMQLDALNRQKKNKSIVDDSWIKGIIAFNYFKKCLDKNPLYLPAKINSAILYNYFNLFEKAKSEFEKIALRQTTPAVHMGLAIAYVGLGAIAKAKPHFEKAFESAPYQSHWVSAYHRALLSHVSGQNSECRDKLDGIEETDNQDLSFLETHAIQYLKEECKE